VLRDRDGIDGVPGTFVGVFKVADEESRESGKRGQQLKGVGRQIALTYVLTTEDPYRFPKSLEVGCLLGLRPGRRNSGESEPQKKMSKQGDRFLRTMMVHCSAWDVVGLPTAGRLIVHHLSL
jgi:transposase